MAKPRIFLGSSGKQEKILQALTRGLGEVAQVEPWTTSFNPGVTTLERLIELTRQVDFAAFVFAQDDWTTKSSPAEIECCRTCDAAIESPDQLFAQSVARINSLRQPGDESGGANQSGGAEKGNIRSSGRVLKPKGRGFCRESRPFCEFEGCGGSLKTGTSNA